MVTSVGYSLFATFNASVKKFRPKPKKKNSRRSSHRGAFPLKRNSLQARVQNFSQSSKFVNLRSDIINIILTTILKAYHLSSDIFEDELDSASSGNINNCSNTPTRTPTKLAAQARRLSNFSASMTSLYSG